MSLDPSFLPYGRHLIEDDDIAAVVQVMRGDALTGGPAVAAFEAGLVEATSARHAVVCGNGTQALHLAVLAAGIGPGDWVICPSITFLATANCARYAGAEVVFADVDPDTGLITAATAEAAAARAGGPVKAVLPVDFAGQFGDLPALSALARQKGWVVIEDACHAAGSRYEFVGAGASGAVGAGASGAVVAGASGAVGAGTSGAVGAGASGAVGAGASGAVGDCRWADYTVFSFHPVKTVAMGEGGAVTTNDAALAARMTSLRNHGMARTADAFSLPEQAFAADGSAHPWYYEMQELGFNYRACDLQCALGLSQLSKLKRFTARRRRLAGLYDERLAGLLPQLRPLGRTPGVIAAWHLYSVLIEFEALGLSRDTVMNRLRAEGIGSQVHYIPVPWQPYYRRRYPVPALPGAAAYYARTLSLPLYPAMADHDVGRVVDALTRALAP